MKTPDRVVYLLDMDAFFASVEERERPELVGRPVMVVGSASPRSVVCAANYEIRKYGVFNLTHSSLVTGLCYSLVRDGEPTLLAGALIIREL